MSGAPSSPDPVFKRAAKPLYFGDATNFLPSLGELSKAFPGHR